MASACCRNFLSFSIYPICQGVSSIGFNAWRETDGDLAIGEYTEQDVFRVEGTDLIMRGIDVPSGFWDCNDAQEKDNIIKKNLSKTCIE